MKNAAKRRRRRIEDLAGPTRLEPATSGDRPRSNQLNYRPRYVESDSTALITSCFRRGEGVRDECVLRGGKRSF